MNLYFFLEDSKSFFKVLPRWLKFILPDFEEIPNFEGFRGDGKNS